MTAQTCDHTNEAIAKAVIERDGVIRAVDAVYSLVCPEDGVTRRNTRLAATIWTLRNKQGMDITTHVKPGMLAEYRLKPPAKPWTVEAVPVADKYECVRCGAIATMASHAHLQPALGGYKQGKCLRVDCPSGNKHTAKNPNYWQPRRK